MAVHLHRLLRLPYPIKRQRAFGLAEPPSGRSAIASHCRFTGAVLNGESGFSTRVTPCPQIRGASHQRSGRFSSKESTTAVWVEGKPTAMQRRAGEVHDARVLEPFASVHDLGNLEPAFSPIVDEARDVVPVH